MNKDLIKSKIRNILLSDDPMKIYSPEDNNIDEYDKEVELIMESLLDVTSEQALLNNIYHIFMMRFGNLGGRTPKERYEKISKEIWQLIKTENVN